MRTELKMEKTVVHETKEYIFIQYLRVIALLLVLWDHIIPGVYYKMGVMPPASIVERYIIWPLAITNYFGAYAVDLFFLITGFLAMESVKKTGPISYLIKRGTRLVPGILFGYLLYIALHRGGVSSALTDYLQINGSLWYVRVLMYFCVIFACCMPILKKSLPIGTFLCQLITILICQIQSASHGSIGAACCYIFYITMGMAIYVLNKQDRYAFPTFIFLFMVSWYGMIHYTIAVYNPERMETGNSFGVSAAYAIMTFLVFLFANERLKKSRVAEVISNYSYGMYVHHMPLFSLVLPVVGTYALPLRVTCYVTAGITILLTFFASYIELRWVDAPCNKFVKILLRRLQNGKI